MKIKRNVEIELNVEKARVMLNVAGFKYVKEMTDDEVLETVLSIITKYGVKYIIR